MREEGTIVGIQGRLARVRMRPSTECGTCCACSALGSGERELEIETALPVVVGSRVAVEIPRGSPWLSAVLLFVLPLAGLILGLVVGVQARMGDAGALVFGFGLLVALFGLAAAIDRAVVRKRVGPPTILEVLDGKEQSAGGG